MRELTSTQLVVLKLRPAGVVGVTFGAAVKLFRVSNVVTNGLTFGLAVGCAHCDRDYGLVRGAQRVGALHGSRNAYSCLGGLSICRGSCRGPLTTSNLRPFERLSRKSERLLVSATKLFCLFGLLPSFE